MKYLKLLKKLSQLSNHPQHKLSCILVNKHNIVSFGYNQLKTHTKSKHPYKALHAEVDCLVGLNFSETKGSTAYTYRETKNGKLALARPCEFCNWILKMSGVKKVIYTVNNSWKEEYI